MVDTPPLSASSASLTGTLEPAETLLDLPSSCAPYHTSWVMESLPLERKKPLLPLYRPDLVATGSRGGHRRSQITALVGRLTIRERNQAEGWTVPLQCDRLRRAAGV